MQAASAPTQVIVELATPILLTAILRATPIILTAIIQATPILLTAIIRRLPPRAGAVY